MPLTQAAHRRLEHDGDETMSVPYLTLFGPPELHDAQGSALRFRTRKQLALLVYLVLEARQHPVPRERLVEMLWHDAPEERGRHSLSQGLTAIREHLGPDAVSRGPGGVRLVAPLRTDLDVLRDDRAGDAVEVAEPLRDLESVGGSEFSHWVDAAREHLVKHARRFLADALDAARARGDVRSVHEQAAQLYRVDPLSDVAVHALAEQALLDRDAPGAVRLLRRHVSRTRDLLGCKPQPDVVRLLKRIEGGAVRPPEPDPGVPQHALRREIFLGRASELARLEAMWSEALSGTLRSAIVLGPSGIGKSALVRRFGTSVAARAWAVWEVACQEIGRNVPFAATSELIQQLLRDPAVGATDPQWLAEATRISPAVRATYPGVPAPPEAPSDSIRLRLAEAVLRMIETAADGGPFLLVVDDVQHMDPASRHVFHVLTRRLESAPAMVLATIRSEDTGATLTGLPRAVEGVDWSAQLELHPLDRVSARQLAAHLCEGDPEEHPTLPDRIVGMAEGNPYLIEMLASDWRANGERSLVERGDDRLDDPTPWRPTSTMRAAFARMYEGLSDEAQQLLRLLAVAGRSVERHKLVDLLPVAPSAVERAVLELIDRGIVRLDAGAIGFKNEPHRAFVYYAVSEDARRYCHARLAEGFAADATDEEFLSTLEAAHHFLKSGMLSEAVALVTKGTEIALAQGAPREAERAIRAVLAHAPAADAPVLHLRLAMALNAEGRYREALEALGRWQSDGATAGQRAAAALTRAESLLRGRLGDDATIADAAQAAADVAKLAGDETRLLHATQLLVEVAAEAGDSALVAELREDARRTKSTAAGPGVGLAMVTEGYCDLFLGDVHGAIHHLSDAVTALEPAPNRGLFRALNGSGIAHHLTCAHQEALSYFHRALVVAKALADDAALSIAFSNLGVAQSDLGDFGAARSMYESALSLKATHEAPRRAAETLYNVAILNIMEGKLDAAAELAEDCHRNAHTAQSARLLREAYLLKADIALCNGHPETAWRTVEEAIQWKAAAGNQLHYQRLRLMYVWATRGYRAFCSLLQDIESRADRAHERESLSRAALTEWIRASEGLESTEEPSAFEEMRDLGLHGMLAYMARIGIADPRVRGLDEDMS